MSQINFEGSVYRRVSLVNPAIGLGILTFLVLLYMLKPLNIQIAEFYVSLSAYHKALHYYRKALEEEKDALSRLRIQERMARTYRLLGELSEYERTVRVYFKEGGRDERLLKDAFEVALELWRRSPEERRSQERVVFWAKVLGAKDFLKKFYLWNNRPEEALALYEEEWLAGKLTLEELSEAVRIARFTSKTKLRIKWLERYYEGGGRKVNLLRELAELYLVEKHYRKALVLLESGFIPGNKPLLARLYADLGRKRKAAEIYLALYRKTARKDFLEKAYFLLAEVSPREAEKLLPRLASYGADYALALASLRLRTGRKEEALKIYLKVWERWRRFEALKAAYALAFEMKRNKILQKLSGETFAWLKKRP